jgi:hypothetical protein
MEDVINVGSPLMEKFPISAVLHKIFKYNAPEDGRTNETL